MSNEKQKRWWEKHLNFKSDKIAEMVSENPEKFMISRTEILQLVLDYKSLKQKFRNLAFFHDCSEQAHEEWESLTEEARQEKRAEFKEIENQIKKIFESS